MQILRKSNRWHLDLSRGPDCWSIPKASHWVFIAAGITSREECEKDPWRSRLVNVVGGIRVARYLERKGTRVVFFGTDLSPDKGEYANQKEELRRAVQDMPHCYYIRLSKVIHPSLPIFQKWQTSLERGKSPKAFAEVKLRPLSPEAVAECVWKFVNSFSFPKREILCQAELEISYVELANRWLSWKGRADIYAVPENKKPNVPKEIKPVPLYNPFINTIRAIDAKKWWNL